MTYTIGSIATDVLARVEDVPTSISGTQLLGIIDEERRYAQEYTGISIGSPSFDQQWRPVLIDLASARVLRYMELQGSDAETVRLGEFSIKKGGGSSSATSATALQQMGLDKLKTFGRKIRFSRVIV